MVRFTFVDTPSATPRNGSRKATFSTSLPESIMNGLETQTVRLKRHKADLIRAALKDFLNQSVDQRDSSILKYYSQSDRRGPKPFTTSLPASMKDEIAATAAAIMRPKADVLRAALWHFFGLPAAEQEQRILKYLSEPGT